ncbi:MAG: T9SS type A sorting domain-containing protein [Bacteroidales bacterium]|nr:T9SS type A sorting domain-containing protein [Bacteroidales bacterium]
MKKNYLMTFVTAALLFAGFALTAFQAGAQVTIAQWTFTGDVTTPSTGSGTANLVGGTTATFATGFAGSPDRAWNSTGYPLQGEGSGTAGVEYIVSTSGYSNVSVSWDGRHSNTSSNRVRLQYTLNGADWINFVADETNASNSAAGVNKGFDGGRYIADAGDTWYQRTASFAGIPGASDNASFAVRMVSEFFDGSGYAASTATSTYSENGTLRYDNVTFQGGGSSPVLTSDPANLSGFTYIDGSGPAESQSVLLNGFNLTPATGTITLDPSEDFEISVNVVDYMGYYQFGYENGALSNMTFYVRMKAGLAQGTYNGTLLITGGGAPDLTVNLSGTVTATTPASIASIMLPMYIQGAVPNISRVPFAYFATLTNLLPNATYRFYNKIVLGSDTPDYNGAGNCIFVDASAGTFTRTSSTSFTTAGQYGEFTTGNDGVYSGWFVTEPTGNATRFKPGAELFVRIVLNDGAAGTIETTRLTSAESVKVLGFYTNSSDTTGTAVRGISNYSAKNFVFLYDNTQGSGRPLYGTQVETSGVDFAGSGSYAAFYTESVAGTNSAWGGIVPNINANGVKRVEERSLSNGAVVASHTSANGVWGTTDTKNPSGGMDNVLVLNTTLGIDSPVSAIGRIYTIGNTLHLELNQVVDGTVQVLNVNGQIVSDFRINNTNASFRTELPEGIYIVRIISDKISVSSKVFIR